MNGWRSPGRAPHQLRECSAVQLTRVQRCRGRSFTSTPFSVAVAAAGALITHLISGVTIGRRCNLSTTDVVAVQQRRRAVQGATVSTEQQNGPGAG